MVNNVSIVLLLAGLSRRFGRDKQVAQLGSHDAWLIDYTLYDAWLLGIQRALFIVRADMLDFMRLQLDRKWGKRLELVYLVQQAPAQLAARVKPWGTGHALLTAQALLAEDPFIVVNGDDFYGRQALASLCDFLLHNQHQALVGYRLGHTLSETGGVSRALCQCDEQQQLQNLEECHELKRAADDQIYDRKKRCFSAEQLVSMNIFAFQAQLLTHLEERFKIFIEKARADEEFYLPTAINALVHQGLKVQVVANDERCYGVTYAADAHKVRQALALLHKNSVYPEKLF